jgi:single-stranded DNA-binding protein
MTSNPNNYPGAEATVVAYAAGPARPPAYDKNGERGILEVSLPVNEGYKKDGEFVQTGTTWYTYTGAGEFAEHVLANVKKGDKIRVQDAKQEVREYQDKDGNTKLGITLRFGTFTVLESKSGDGFVPDDSEPF